MAFTAHLWITPHWLLGVGEPTLTTGVLVSRKERGRCWRFLSLWRKQEVDRCVELSLSSHLARWAASKIHVCWERSKAGRRSEWVWFIGRKNRQLPSPAAVSTHARVEEGGGVTETGWWITSFGAFESTGKNWQVVLHCIKKTYYRKYIVIAKKSSKRMLCPSSLFLDGPLRYVVVASSFTFSGRHCSVILVILSIPTATLLCVLYSVIFTYSLFTPQLFIYWALIFFSWELGWNINNILLSVF